MELIRTRDPIIPLKTACAALGVPPERVNAHEARANRYL